MWRRFSSFMKPQTTLSSQTMNEFVKETNDAHWKVFHSIRKKKEQSEYKKYFLSSSKTFTYYGMKKQDVILCNQAYELPFCSFIEGMKAEDRQVSGRLLIKQRKTIGFQVLAQSSPSLFLSLRFFN